jgi:DNA-binding NtrC family response regulator
MSSLNRVPVMVVSSDSDTQDMYLMQLRTQRVPVVGVSDADEAVAMADRHEIRVVLFDVDRHDDWECLARFVRQRPTIPVVVLTGWISGDRSYRALAHDLGCAGFLGKPCQPDLVTEALQHAAERRPWFEYVDGSSEQPPV